MHATLNRAIPKRCDEDLFFFNISFFPNNSRLNYIRLYFPKRQQTSQNHYGSSSSIKSDRKLVVQYAQTVHTNDHIPSGINGENSQSSLLSHNMHSDSEFVIFF